jgi:mannose-6-phosphate isomerase-like protein (cupin superfamily)
LVGQFSVGANTGETEEVVALVPGLCLTIPLGTHFQFRASSTESVYAVAITMPPWPGEGEVIFAPGPWAPSPL